MEFWNHKVNVSKQAARIQVSILNSFSSEKRLKIALDFANMGIDQTRSWIKKNHPEFSDLEVTKEFVRIQYYETGQMNKATWDFFQKRMDKKINQDWAKRFRNMMKTQNLSYTDIAKMGGFKNAKVVEATISRGLPRFARVAVLLHEKGI